MAQELVSLDKGKLQAYGKYTTRLTTVTMVIWFVVTCGAIIFSPELNTVVIFGFPLGYYVGAQGALIIFVILIFNYAFRMNKADADYGVQKETD
jgi:putative solute:sodium symporter small subunit